MKNKKFLIFVPIIILVLICLIFIIYIVHNNSHKLNDQNSNIIENKNNNNNDNNKIDDSIDDSNKNANEEINKDDSINDTKATTSVNTTPKNNSSNNTSNNTKANNQTKNSNNSSTNNNNQTPTPTPNPTPTPAITYYCPDGYNLVGTQCTSVISASYVCPENTTDFSTNNIPQNTYCVNLSEGYITEDGCPSGYGLIEIISLGGPTKNKCLPLHRKIYVCNDGYSLNGTNCSKTIDALKR